MKAKYLVLKLQSWSSLRAENGEPISFSDTLGSCGYCAAFARKRDAVAFAGTARIVEIAAEPKP